MKSYRGVRKDAGTVVTVTKENVTSKLDPRFDLRNHSPTGFEWGYGGSGPAQLSLAMLADCLGDDRMAQEFYQDFKFKVIGRFKGDEWTLTAKEIESVMAELKHCEATNG